MAYRDSNTYLNRVLLVGSKLEKVLTIPITRSFIRRKYKMANSPSNIMKRMDI